MGHQTYKVARMSDSQIVSALVDLATDIGPFQIHINALSHGLGTIPFPDHRESKLSEIASLNSELIDYFGGAIAGVNISYYRGGQQGAQNEKSPILDDINVDTQGNDFARLAIAAKIIAIFKPVKLPGSTEANAIVEEQRAIQESTFARLERQLEQLFQQTLDVRQQLDARVRVKEDELEEDFRKKASALEDEVTQKKQALAEEESKLEARKQQLDDSDNTFARRQIRERMLQDVTDRVTNFGVSSVTNKARVPVFAGIAFLGVFLLACFSWTLFELHEVKLREADISKLSSMPVSAIDVAKSTASASDPASNAQRSEFVAAERSSISNEKIALWIRLSLLSFGVIATAIYYIRWENQWAAQFAGTEHELKQFHIDVNRANWVVETCLEWRKDNQSEIPSSLIESLTRGLFADRDQSKPVLHPADELASALLGTASKVSLDVSGNRLEIDNPRKIPKAVLPKG